MIALFTLLFSDSKKLSYTKLQLGAAIPALVLRGRAFNTHHPQPPQEQDLCGECLSRQSHLVAQFPNPCWDLLILGGICSWCRSSESVWCAVLDTYQLQDSRCLMAVGVYILPVAPDTSVCTRNLNQYFYRYIYIYLYNNTIKLQC